MDINEIIQAIETNKHDLTLRLRAVVYDPIESLLEENAVTSLYLSTIGKESQEIFIKAEKVMDFFGSKWRDGEDNGEKGLQNLRDGVNKLQKEIIPLIEDQILPHYIECKNNISFINTESREGRFALNKVMKASENWPIIKKSLLKLDDLYQENNIFSTVNLLEILQAGLDDLKADVIYQEPEKMFSVEINIDRDKFLDKVLHNIRENIEKHAYGAKDYSTKLLTQKHVGVSCVKEGDKIKISIKNDGKPFKGSVDKIFDYGYCHGETRNSGIGLHSVRQSLREMGGDIEFKALSDGVEYIIII